MPFPNCISIPNGALSPEKEAILEQKKENRRIEKSLSMDRRRELSCLKLLLLGPGESGKSTIIKQMKIIHINGFSKEEKEEYIPFIKKNVRDAIVAIIAAMENLKIPFEYPENDAKRQYLIHEAFSPSFDYPPEFFECVRELWKDRGVQSCYQRSNEYQLIDSAKYFLDRLDVIRSPGYIPTQQDILRCRKMTNAISEITFQIKEKKGTTVNFKVFDVGGQRGERKKWIQLFDSVTAILFVADCSSYDLTLREDKTKSRLIDALEVFQQTWLNKYLQSVPILVFLNKIDLLQEKIIVGRLLSDFLPTLQPSTSGDTRALPSSEEHSEGNANSLTDSVKNRRTSHPIPQVSIQSSNGAVNGNPTTVLETSSANSRLNKRSSLVSAFSLKATNPSLKQQKPPQGYANSNSTSAHSTTTDIFLRLPFDRYKPNEMENREFIHSFPLDEGGRTLNSLRGHGHRTRSRDLPNVHPQTIKTACYIKNIFTEITKERASPYSNSLSRERKSLFFYTCAVNTDNIQKVLDGCRVFLMEEHLEKFGIL